MTSTKLKHQKLTIATHPTFIFMTLFSCIAFIYVTICSFSNFFLVIFLNRVLILRMAHWFHRNPLKATAPVSFNYYGVAGSPAANKICKCVTSLPFQIVLLLTTINALFLFPYSLIYCVDTQCSMGNLVTSVIKLPDNLATLPVCQQFTRLVHLQTQWPSNNEGETAGDVHRCHLQPWDDEKCYRCIFVPTARYGRWRRM